jgi:ribosomal protein S18 acetylase RimI-like enzyme
LIADERPLVDLAARIVPRDPATHVRLAVPADQPFVRHLYKSSRAVEFAATGLPATALEALLDQQFQAQARGYASQFSDAVTLIIVRNNEPVGRLILCGHLSRWHIVDIMLLPEARGSRIGTDVIEAVAEAARRDGARELTLSVLSTNDAARKLYARLGFQERQAGVHIAMSRTLLT